MRQAYHDVGWLVQPEETQFFGFSLGYDFCAEHEFGAEFIKSELGIAQTDFPVGVEDRTMTQVPETLYFGEYELRSKDKRVKKTMPAALLYLARIYGEMPQSVPERAKRLDASFMADFRDKWYEPERHDIVSAWADRSGFAIHVRGEENVARLRELYEAFQRKAVSVADASGMGFIRKALSLVIVDRFPDEVKQTVRERDLAHKRLYDAFEATGIKERLKAAGRNWYALRPRWRNGEEAGELLAYLNPCEQKKYDCGWYTVAELDEWANGAGPVVDGRAVEAALKAIDKEWSYRLLKGLNDAGIAINGHVSVWTDDAKTIPGLRMRVSPDSQDKLADGTYSISALMPYIKRGRELHLAEKAAYEAKKAAKEKESA